MRLFCPLVHAYASPFCLTSVELRTNLRARAGAEHLEANHLEGMVLRIVSPSHELHEVSSEVEGELLELIAAHGPSVLSTDCP